MVQLYNTTREQLFYAIGGGLMVGLATTLFFFLFGRYFLMSEHLKGLVRLNFGAEFMQKISLLAGLIFSAALIRTFYHEHIISFWPYDSNAYHEDIEPMLLIVSGFLVGLGSGVDDGSCTYQIMTGLPRLRLKSFLSILVFGLSAYLVAEFKLWYAITSTIKSEHQFEAPENLDEGVYLLLTLIAPFICFVFSKSKSLRDLVQFVCIFVVGVLTGIGMMIGGATNLKSNVHLFQFDIGWKPTILFFFLTVMIFNFITHHLIKRMKSPILASSFPQEESSRITLRQILGSVLFGVGWALTGMNIGPAYLMIPLKNTKVIFYWGLSCFVGMKIVDILQTISAKIKQINEKKKKEREDREREKRQKEKKQKEEQEQKLEKQRRAKEKQQKEMLQKERLEQENKKQQNRW